MSESEPDLNAFDTAAAKWPKKKKAQIRRAWPKIKAMLTAGHTLKEAHAVAVKSKISIAYQHFATYVKEIRLEEEIAAGITQTQKAPVTPPQKGESSSFTKQLAAKVREQRAMEQTSFSPTQVTDPSKFY